MGNSFLLKKAIIQHAIKPCWIDQPAFERLFQKSISTNKKVILSIGKINPTSHASTPSKKSAASIISGSTMLNQDFREFIQSLNDNDVRYLIVGGYAVALH